MWTIEAAPLDSPESEALLRAYFADIVERYYRRAVPAEHIDAVVEEYRLEALAEFLIARWDGRPVGCAGLCANGTVTRVYVDPAYRRRGGGRLLLEGLEASARALGLEQLRLDTREDLVEAQALYRAAGWVEVEPFNDDEYADRFFAKPLD